jgi:hypothetical protein
MGSQTNVDLNDIGFGKGKTQHYAFTYDSTAFLSSTDPEDGCDLCNALMNVVEQDFTLMQSRFPNVDFSTQWTFSFAVKVTQQSSTVQYGDRWTVAGPTISLTSPTGMSVDFPRYLLIDEVTEMFMAVQRNGWGIWTDSSSGQTFTEGSDGEGLSRFLGVQMLINNGLDLSILYQPSIEESWWIAPEWLSTTDRPDYINLNPDPSDNKFDAINCCTTMFVWYLYKQLGFPIQSIINNKGVGNTMASTYNQLTEVLGNPFPFFSRLLANTYPPGSYNRLGSDLDNPFPLGILTFWGVQSRYVWLECCTTFTLVIEGLSQHMYQQFLIASPFTTVFLFTGSLLVATSGITISPTPANPGDPPPVTPIVQYEDASNIYAPQRISF